MVTTRERLDSDPFASALGIELVEEDEDTLTLRLVLEERHHNFGGITHGGVVFSLADTAMGLLSNSEDRNAVAVDTHLVLRAGTAEGKTLTAQVTRRSDGRQLGTYHVTVTRDDGKIVGLFTGTVLNVG